MLGDPITRRALVEVLILALALGPLGVWVLLHRRAYAAESLSHGLLPGLVLAALAGAPLVLGAAGGALVAAGASALAGRDERIGSDIGVAVAVSALFEELRGEGRTLLVATHDARQARAWQRVLCLNRTQVAFGAPAEVLTPDVLQATYGGELVVLADGSTAVSVEHHGHEH